MVNDTPQSKLDEVVKQTLTSFEGGYDAADWSRMERMLDAAPKPAPFKWTHFLNGLIAIAVCGGIYLVYLAVVSSADKTTPVTTTMPPPPPVAPRKSQPATLTPDPPVVTNESPVITTPVPPAAGSAVLSTANQKLATETSATVAKPKSQAAEAAASPAEDPELRNLRVIGMGNEPVFGDMLDSSRGIVSETKETKETKEAAKKGKDLPVGWNNFMLSNVNPDSIKNYRERMKKDTIKNP